jgi:hypothetical protein
MTIAAGAIRDAVLLEVDPAGRPARLELTTAAGMLTLHPEADGRSLHGNVVTPTGMRHLALDWSPEHEIDIDGIPIPMAVAVHRHRAIVGVGEERSVPVAAITPDLDATESHRRLARRDGSAWLVDDGTRSYRLVVDERGIPVMAGADEWPLEI